MRQPDDERPKLNFNSCFFKIFRDKDEVTIDEAYALCHKRVDNNTFIRNKLTIWKKLGIAEPIYESPIQNSKLMGIRLTALGQSYFHRTVPGQASKTLTASELLTIVADFKKQHPDINVTFELHWMSTHTDREKDLKAA
jgi:hypothetical protein